MVQNQGNMEKVSAEEKSITVGEERHVELVGKFDRLFNTCSIYPAGHVRFGGAERSFREALIKAVGGDRMLCIDGDRESLLVQSHEVSRSFPEVEHLHGILTSLGIARVEMDTAYTRQDLYDFITLLLRHRHEVEAARSFRQFEFKDLPPAIRVFQREFGKRVSNVSGRTFRNEQIGAAVENSLEALEGHNLDEEERAACQRWVENVFTKVADRFEVGAAPRSGSKGAFTRSLEDVLGLAANAVQHAVTEMFSGNRQAGDMQHLYGAAEKAVAFSENEDAVKIMVKVLQHASRDAAENSKSTARENSGGDDCGYNLSLPELRRSLAECAALAEPVDTLESEDRSEHLSVLLQILLDYPTPKVLAGIGRELNRFLSGDLQTRERSVLSAAIHELLGRMDYALIDRSLPLLLRPFRRLRSVSDFLLNICRPSSLPELEAIWPHMVNEILMGLEGEGSVKVMELHRQAVGLSEAGMREEVLRVECLEAIQENRFSRQIFRPPIPELFPIFAALLSSSRTAAIGQFLLKGLQTHPPGWAGAEALLFLKEYNTSCQEFLIKLLHDHSKKGVSKGLQRMAAAIIVDALDSLPEDCRVEPRVPKAIRALGSLSFRKVEPILLKVLKSRKYLFLHTWPAACRRSARQALRELRSPPEITEVIPGE